MPGNTIGRNFAVTTFGESHGPAIVYWTVDEHFMFFLACNNNLSILPFCNTT